MSTASSNLWLYDSFGGYNQALRPVSFLDKRQNARLERLRCAKLLYTGQHRQFFWEERRTQFDVVPTRVGDRVIYLYVTFNVLGLISRKSADLLFGEAPAIRSDDPQLQTAIDAITDRSQLHPQLFQGAIESSWAAETALSVSLGKADGLAYITQVAAERIFPEGEIQPNRQYVSYVQFDTAKIGTDDAPITLLLKTRYSAGLIERSCFQLDGEIQNPVDLASWPIKDSDDKSPLPETEATGLSAPTIIWVPNELEGDRPRSDYDGLIELQDSLNAKQTQIARVLAKHSDPKLVADARAADKKGNLDSTADALFENGDTRGSYRYLTWNAELASAIDDRKFVLNALCIAAEMSQVLLGIKEGAAPDAARKLRLEATNSLAKAQRKAAYWTSAIRQAMQLALQLERGPVGPVIAPPAVEIKDGLPVDPLDVAQLIATLRPVGALSQERAVEMQNLGTQGTAKELVALKREAEEATPSVFIRSPEATGENPDEQTDRPTEASAAEAA